MRFTLSALAVVASLSFASAQFDLGNIPDCAIPCFATAVSSAGCSVTDRTCQCTTGRDKITASVTACVPDKCSADDIAKIAPAVEDLCAQAGITVTDLPTAAATSGGSSPSAKATATPTTGSAASGTSAPAQQSTNAAVANVAQFGAVAFGVAAVFGL